MRIYLDLIGRSIAHHWQRWAAISLGFVVLYYGILLLLTMLRFGEIPNYLVFHHVIKNYKQILDGTPALSDAVPILLDEPWLETGFKDPNYYGVASWSYMLIPPKVLIVLFTGMLAGTMGALAATGKRVACRVVAPRTYIAAGVGAGLVGLANVTLTWVVCCATPSWVVALTMLGVMSVSAAASLQPYGSLLNVAGLLMFIAIIAQQARKLVRAGGHVQPPPHRRAQTDMTHVHA